VTGFSEAAKRVEAGADAHEQARGLLARMTLEEKLGCLDGDTPFWPGTVDVGHGGYHAHPWPAARVERLGVPGIRFADGPRGCVIGASTAFPVSMARGASFDPDLERSVVQLYGAVPTSPLERPPKRLVGFARVTLDAGASRRIDIPIARSLLDVRRKGAWVREPHPVVLSIGFDAASARPL
jgi:hypothetical protein